MAQPKNRIDGEIINLDGGLFSSLPEQVIPLEAYGLSQKIIEPEVSDYAATQVMRRVKLDSIAPMALTAPPIDHAAPVERSSRSWMVGAAVAFGVGCLLTAGVLTRVKPAASAAPQAALVVTVPQLVAVPVPAETKVEAPATKVEAEPSKAQPIAAKVEPIATKAVPVAAKAEPIATKPQALPAKVDAPKVEAPAALPKADAAPVSTADLPMEMPEIPPAPKAPEVPFKASAAAVAIADAGLRAESCKDIEGSMSVPVSVTFAASGRVTKATINGGPFAGTAAGSCIAQALRSASVPSFDGEPVTVNTTLRMR